MRTSGSSGSTTDQEAGCRGRHMDDGGQSIRGSGSTMDRGGQEGRGKGMYTDNGGQEQQADRAGAEAAGSTMDF